MIGAGTSKVAKVRGLILVGLLALAASCKSAERERPARDASAPAVPRADAAVSPHLLPEASFAEVLDLPAEAPPDEVERRVYRALELMDAFFETIVEHQDDCDAMARALDRFLEVNQTMLSKLRELEGHKTLIEKLQPKLDAWIKGWMPRLGPAMQKCVANRGVSEAFKKLAEQN